MGYYFQPAVLCLDKTFGAVAKPEHLSFPTLRWSTDRRAGETAPEFIYRVWKDWMDLGVLARAHLLQARDRPLYEAVRDYERKHPGQFHLPTRKEIVDSRLAKRGIGPKNPRIKWSENNSADYWAAVRRFAPLSQ